MSKKKPKSEVQVQLYIKVRVTVPFEAASLDGALTQARSLKSYELLTRGITAGSQGGWDDYETPEITGLFI